MPLQLPGGEGRSSVPGTQPRFSSELDPVDMVAKVKLLMVQRELSTEQEVLRLKEQLGASTDPPVRLQRTSQATGDVNTTNSKTTDFPSVTDNSAPGASPTGKAPTPAFPTTSFLGRYLLKYPETHPDALGLTEGRNDDIVNDIIASNRQRSVLPPRLPPMTTLGAQTLVASSSHPQAREQEANVNDADDDDEGSVRHVDKTRKRSQFTGLPEYGIGAEVRSWVDKMREIHQDAKSVTSGWTAEEVSELEQHIYREIHKLSTAGVIVPSASLEPTMMHSGRDGAYPFSSDGGLSLRDMSANADMSFASRQQPHHLLGSGLQHFGPTAAVSLVRGGAPEVPAYFSSFAPSDVNITPRSGDDGAPTGFSQSFGGEGRYSSEGSALTPTNGLPTFGALSTSSPLPTQGAHNYDSQQQQQQGATVRLPVAVNEILCNGVDNSPGAVTAKATVAAAEKAVFNRRLEFLTDIVKNLQEMCETVYIGRGTASVAVTLEDILEGKFSNVNNVGANAKLATGGSVPTGNKPGPLSYLSTPEVVDLSNTFDLNLEVLSRAVESWYYSVTAAGGGRDKESSVVVSGSSGAQRGGQSSPARHTVPAAEAGRLVVAGNGTSEAIFSSNPHLFPNHLTVNSAKRAAGGHAVQGIAAAAMGEGMMLTSAQVEQVLRAFYAQGARQRESLERNAEEQIASGTIEGISFPPAKSTAGATVFLKSEGGGGGAASSSCGGATSTHVYLSADARTKRLQGELAKAYSKEDALRRQLQTKTAALKEENAQLRAVVSEMPISGVTGAGGAVGTTPNLQPATTASGGGGGGGGGTQPKYHLIALDATGGDGNTQRDSYGARELLLRNPALIESFNTITSVVAETLAAKRTRYLRDHVETLRATVESLKAAHEVSKAQTLALSEENEQLKGELKQLNSLWGQLEAVRKQNDEERKRQISEGGTEVERLRAASSAVVHFTISALTQMLNAVDKREAAYKAFACQWEDLARASTRHLRGVVDGCLAAAAAVTALKLEASREVNLAPGSVRDKSVVGARSFASVNDSFFPNNSFFSDQSLHEVPSSRGAVVGGGSGGGANLPSLHASSSAQTRSLLPSSTKLPSIAQRKRPAALQQKPGSNSPKATSIVQPSNATARAVTNVRGGAPSTTRLPPITEPGSPFLSPDPQDNPAAEPNWMSPRSGNISTNSSRRSSLATGIVVGDHGSPGDTPIDGTIGLPGAAASARPSVRAKLHHTSLRQAQRYETKMAAKTALSGPMSHEFAGAVGAALVGDVAIATTGHTKDTVATAEGRRRRRQSSTFHGKSPSDGPGDCGYKTPSNMDFALFTPRTMEATVSMAQAPLPSPYASGGRGSVISTQSGASQLSPLPNAATAMNSPHQRSATTTRALPTLSNAVAGASSAQSAKLANALAAAKAFLASKGASAAFPQFPIHRVRAREEESKLLLTNWCDQVQDELGNFLTGGTQVYLDELVDMYGKRQSLIEADDEDASDAVGFVEQPEPLHHQLSAADSALSPSQSGSHFSRMPGSSAITEASRALVQQLREQVHQHQQVIQGLTTKLDAAVGESRDKFREARFIRATVRYFINCVDAVCAGGYSDTEHGMVESDGESTDEEQEGAPGSALYNLDRSKKKREERRRKRLEEHIYPPAPVTDPDTQYRYAWSQECQQLERVFMNLRAMLMGMLDKTDSTNAMLSAIREFKKATGGGGVGGGPYQQQQGRFSNSPHASPSTQSIIPPAAHTHQFSMFGGGGATTPIHSNSINVPSNTVTPRRDARTITDEKRIKQQALLSGPGGDQKPSPTVTSQPSAPIVDVPHPVSQPLLSVIKAVNESATTKAIQHATAMK